MERGKIIKHFTKFIFPFKYQKNDPKKHLNETLPSSKGNHMNIWERCGIDGNELREDIAEFFAETEKECSARIADCYSLNINCRSALDLPRQKGDVLTFVYRNNNHKKITIIDVRLYLFESEVGFAEITCEYQSHSTTDYIDCNYFISEIKSDKNYFVFSRRDADARESEIKFSVKELLQRIVAYVGEVQYFDNKGKEFSESKPIIYSYLLLDEKPDDLETLLFLSRKNYKDSYKLPQKEYAIHDNPNILQTFENSYWATSLNGAVNVSFLVGSKITDEFFISNFSPRILAAYYHIFLSVLHQKYAMRHYVEKMGQLDKIVKEYSIMKRQLIIARGYRAQAASLKFRAFFSIPSNIEHINKYFNLVRNSYEIDTLYGDFNEDIENLISLCDTYVSSINDHNDMIQKRKRKRLGLIVTLVGALVSFIALFSSSWAILEKIYGETLSFFSPQILVVFGVLLFSIIAVALCVPIKDGIENDIINR